MTQFIDMEHLLESCDVISFPVTFWYLGPAYLLLLSDTVISNCIMHGLSVSCLVRRSTFIWAGENGY